MLVRYDPQDFLGRLIGNAGWVRHAEKSFFAAIDHNYFATQFHIDMFDANLLNDGMAENPWRYEDMQDYISTKKIVRSGWPMEYMQILYQCIRTCPSVILFCFRIVLLQRSRLRYSVI
jgi:starvation-inducible outer membrane lipoprotein